MARVAIFDGPQVKTFQYDADTDVDLEFLRKEDAQELSKEVEKIVARTGSDWNKVWNARLGRRVVKGWRHRFDQDHPGFVFPDDTPIPFTEENLDMMMARNREFSIFVGENTISAKEFLAEKVKKGEVKIKAKNG
jgi:hypothetical protein